MRPLLLTTLVASLALANAAAQEKIDPKKELEQFQGTWIPAKFDVPADKKLPEGFLEKARFVFKGDKLVTMFEGKNVDEATFKLDPTKKPKWFDVSPSGGPNKGKTSEGIYEFDEDTLKICMGAPGQKRPTEFKVVTEAGSKTALMVLKREKPSCK